MEKLYLMRLREIQNFEIQFLEKPGEKNGGLVRDKLVEILSKKHFKNIPKDHRQGLIKRRNEYLEYCSDELPEDSMLEQIENNPLPCY